MSATVKKSCSIPSASRVWAAVTVCLLGSTGVATAANLLTGFGDLSNWLIVDEGDRSDPSSWLEDGSALVQTSNIYSNPKSRDDLAKAGTYALFEGGSAWVHYRLRVTLESSDNDTLGVMFRYRDADNYYRFSWNTELAYRRLEKKQDGQFTLLAEDPIPYTRGQSYLVDIAAEGERLTVHVDGESVFSVEDAGLPSGTIALYAWGNRGARFESMTVDEIETPPEAPDDPEEPPPGEPPPDGTMLLVVGDDFSDWTVVDEGDRSAPSSWSGENGLLEQTSNIHSMPKSREDVAKPGTFVFYNGGGDWSDYRMRTMVRSNDNDALGVMFYYRDPGNYYRFSCDRELSYRRLVKCVDGQFTLLAEDDVPYTVGQEYDLEVDAVAGTIAVRIDGEVIFSAADSSLSRGSVAFYSWGNRGSVFADTRVVTLGSTLPDSPPEEPPEDPGDDVNEPPAITLLTAEPSSILDSESARLAAVAADVDAGPAALSYSWSVEAGGGTIDFPTAPEAMYTPPDVGDTQQFVVTLEVSDGSDTVSQSLTVTVHDDSGDVDPDTPLLVVGDDVSDWVIVDEGDRSAPSSWNGESGGLMQTSNIYSEPKDREDLSKLGTFAFYDGGQHWVDYRLLSTVRSDDNDGFGVMFCFQDPANYYRFSCNRELSYRRLVKCENGQFTLLAEDSVPYTSGRNYTLEVVAAGGVIEVNVDGGTVFRVADSSLDRGTVAFYSWGNRGSHFNDIRVLHASADGDPEIPPEEPPEEPEDPPEEPPSDPPASITLSWDAPLVSADGSSLDDLAGFRVYYGTTAGRYDLVAGTVAAGVTEFTMSLPAGTYHFSVTAFDLAENESAFSEGLSVSVP